MKYFWAFISAIPAAVTILSAQGLYVGCFDQQLITTGAVGEYLYSGQNGDTPPCDCGSIGYNYGFVWRQYGGVGIYESCYCTNTTPSFRYFLNSDIYCDPGVNRDGEASVIAGSPQTSQWINGRCFKPNTAISGIYVTDLFECLTHCENQGSKYAALVTHRRYNTATCACYSTPAIWADLPIERDCGWEDMHIYISSAQPSGCSRRKR